MTVRKATLLSLITLIAVLAVPVLRAQSGEEQDAGQPESFNGSCGWACQRRQQQAQRLEGSWVSTVTIVVPPGVPQPPPFRVYFTFARGGGFIGTDMRRPTNNGHGAWEHLGGNEFAFTSIQEVFDAAGNFAGTFKGRGKITMKGRNAFVGVTNAEQRNAAGAIIVNGCSTIQAERIKVEPLATQCQSIEPPR